MHSALQLRTRVISRVCLVSNVLEQQNLRKQKMKQNIQNRRIVTTNKSSSVRNDTCDANLKIPNKSREKALKFEVLNKHDRDNAADHHFLGHPAITRTTRMGYLGCDTELGYMVLNAEWRCKTPFGIEKIREFPLCTLPCLKRLKPRHTTPMGKRHATS